MISFQHIPDLPDSDYAKYLMTHLAATFVPIIQQRGYDILHVSEFCCCGDALEYNPNMMGSGGGKYCIPKHYTTLQGNTREELLGYHHVVRRKHSRYSKPQHTIHLRLRHPKNHHLFFKLETVVTTMAHELAHYVHIGHGPEFWNLMDELVDQYQLLLACFREDVTTVNELPC